MKIFITDLVSGDIIDLGGYFWLGDITDLTDLGRDVTDLGILHILEDITDLAVELR